MGAARGACIPPIFDLSGSLCFFRLAGWVAPQSGRYAPPAGTPTIRVLLLENQQEVNVSATAMPTIHVGPQGPAQQLQFPAGSSVPVSLTPAGWQIGSAQLGTGELLLEQSVDGSVRIDKHAYHGRYRFIPVAGGRFDVINDVDLEGYLARRAAVGVVRQLAR